MKNRCTAAALIMAFIVPLSVNAQDAATKQIASRIELHAIPSLTLSDEQFLKGDASGKSVVVSGLLRIAQGSGRLPVVVMIHGSGGMGPNIDLWTRDFNEMGISTLALDGFTGRGLTSVNTDQALLGAPTGEPVLVLHGTSGSGASMLSKDFADELFGPGQPLDASRYYLILPDALGTGQSTRPSDGLRAKFPRYNYDDMVLAQYRLLTEAWA
jgi:pimeloyl-ACP methyl ester carboxylesterase